MADEEQNPPQDQLQEQPQEQPQEQVQEQDQNGEISVSGTGEQQAPVEGALFSSPTEQTSLPVSEEIQTVQQPTETVPLPTSEAPVETPKETQQEQTESMKKKSSTSKSRRGKTINLENAKIGFIGGGKVAEYLVNGLINFVKIPAKRIHVAAPSTKNTDHFKNLGCNTTKRNIDIFGRYDCDIVFLCFHGGVVKYCYKLGGARPRPITTNYIPNMKHAICILSMVSGVSLDNIKAVLLNPEHPKGYILEIHRVMLNAACAYGLGICAIDVEPDSDKLSAPIRTLLSTIGRLEYVPESQMDAACAIAGNGLAFGYYLMNAMADGAFKMGLSRSMAIKFAAKTVHCGAQCLLESGLHPSELRDAVTAAGGPAIYGIHVLDKADVASGIQGAVESAYKRAAELAETETSS